MSVSGTHVPAVRKRPLSTKWGWIAMVAGIFVGAIVGFALRS